MQDILIMENLLKKWHSANHCAADDAPATMRKEKNRLKIIKEENQKMIHVHCVIHRELSVNMYYSCS